MKISKRYISSFVAEVSKINRLMSIVREGFSRPQLQPEEHFEIQFEGGRTFETDLLEQVFQLDNSRRNHIAKLSIQCKASANRTETEEQSVTVEFDAQPPADVRLSVISKDAKWATDVFSTVEEQVERMLQTGVFARLKNSPFAAVMLPLVVLLVLTATGLTLALGRDLGPSQLSRTMWLTKDDINTIEKGLAASSGKPPEYQEVITRQLRNIANDDSDTLLPKKYRDPRILFIVLPILASLGSVIYLYLECYPIAVFIWGDAEEWYKGLLSRRKAIWSFLFGSLLVGVVANLFVFGLTTLGR